MERRHMARVADLGCIACFNQHGIYSPSTVHHIRKQGAKTDHYKTIPLCPPHHLQQFGPQALHSSLRDFEAKHGTEYELLDQVNELLRLAA